MGGAASACAAIGLQPPRLMSQPAVAPLRGGGAALQLTPIQTLLHLGRAEKAAVNAFFEPSGPGALRWFYQVRATAPCCARPHAAKGGQGRTEPRDAPSTLL